MITVLALSALPVTSQTISNPLLYSGHYYGATLDCMTWLQADTFATRQYFVNPATNFLLQGHLVTITTPEEQNFVHYTFVGGEWTHAWLGAYRTSDGPAKNWAWVTGEPWSYEHWFIGEPANLEETAGSIMNYTGGTWHDYPDNYQSECGLRYTVVEFEPPIYHINNIDVPGCHKKHVRLEIKGSLPIKLELADRLGNQIDGKKIKNRPLISVYRSSDSALIQADTLTYHGKHWKVTLKLRDKKHYSGDYHLVVVSGNADEYSILPDSGFTLDMPGGHGKKNEHFEKSGGLRKEASLGTPERTVAGDQNHSIKIFTASGRLVWSIQGSGPANFLSVKTGLLPGIYFAAVREPGNISTRRLVIR